MHNVPWDDRPPSEPVTRLGIQVHRLEAGEERFYRLLGPWKGAWLHWGERRSIPCLGDLKCCQLCPDDFKRWEGYAPALLWDPTARDPATDRITGRWHPVVLPISEALRDDLARLREGVAGLVFRLKRLRSRRKLHEWAFLEKEHNAYKYDLPPAFDVVPTLLRMWRLAMGPKPRPTFLSDDQAGAERSELPPGEAQPG